MRWIQKLVVFVFFILASTISLAIAKPPGHVVRVGLLYIVAPAFSPNTNAFDRELVEGLRDLGYTPGKDILFEFRSARGNSRAFPQLTAELVSSKVDMLVIPGTEPVIQAAKVTRTTPIVMVGTADPVETGLIASLARPGGNITGLAINAAELSAKRVQLLQETVPGLSCIAVLWNQSVKSMTLGFHAIEQASPQLGTTIYSIGVSGPDDFDQAFGKIERVHPGGLVVLYGPLRGDDLPRIIRFVTSHRLPTIFQPIEGGARGGGLMEFGPKFLPMARRAAAYIDKIANGENPATLPVEEPDLFHLVINLKAAKSLGITIPKSMLLRADQIIE